MLDALSFAVGLRDDCFRLWETWQTPLNDKIALLLDLVPSEKRETLRDLSHWLLCCKYLWPDAPPFDEAVPASSFSLHNPFQSFRIDPNAVHRTVGHILDDHGDEFLAGKMLNYVMNGSDDDWQALCGAGYPATRIDPTDAPLTWPREYLVLALGTLDMKGADLRRADLRKATLSGIAFANADLSDADFSGSSLTAVSFIGCDMRDCDLRAAQLHACFVSRSRLDRALLQEADMRGIKMTSSRWRGARLTGANLSWAKIKKCDFRRADMYESLLEHARLKKCDMPDAMLNNACLRHAKLHNTNLENAWLNCADLSHAKLLKVRFSSRDGNLSDAVFKDATLSDVDIGFDDHPDQPFPLQKNLLPRLLDHTLREALRSCGQEYDSEPDGAYLDAYSDSDDESPKEPDYAAAQIKRRAIYCIALLNSPLPQLVPNNTNPDRPRLPMFYRAPPPP